MAGNLITSLLSLGPKLLPSIRASVQASFSSSSNSNNSERERAQAFEQDLEWLMRTLEWIKATMYDAEERKITDRSVKLWLKELKKVAYAAEDVLSEYQYEVTRVQVEAGKASEASSSHNRKQMEFTVSIPDDLVNRLKKIRGRFDDIAKDRESLQLRESDGKRCPSNKNLRPPTGHMVDEATIFGREAEIKKVISSLLSEKEKSFSVISIVGKGGLGKTTIAQLIYRDERVSQCFDLFGWVCVSEEFDVKRLIKATIESVSEKNCDVSELSPLQKKLAATVKGKTMMLVLDDVWNENKSLWESFRVAFKEANMVRILVTTRNKKVAEVMETTSCFNPSYLPEDSCWQLFQHYAFTVPTHLVNMGSDIMRKCGGLPLAVKSIASLLRHETYEECWREILESDLWESNPSNYIFPALQISYAHLPAHLKPCFLFCSMYPKDYILEKMHLIDFWIAHGYIECKGKRKITEIGVEYYEELKQRSFLDEYYEDRCKLHDIIHDFAQLNSESEHYSLEINQPLVIHKKNVPQETCHLYVGGCIGYVNQILQPNLKGLRTLYTNLRACSGDCISNTEAMDLISKLSEFYKECSRDVQICNLTRFEALRVLELKGDYLKRIPDSISELKHLAYLSITSPCLKMLPSSIGHLYNLQTLVLNCSILEYLPESVGDLLNLQFLKIPSNNLSNLPKSLGKLSNLLRLSIRCHNFLDFVPHGLVNFSAIKTMRARLRVKTIAWLNEITDLEGDLTIHGMSNLKDAQRGNMRNKCKLETLNLSWEIDYLKLNLSSKTDYLEPFDGKELEILILEPFDGEDNWVNDAAFSWLESLQPHPNLKKLHLHLYSPATFPGWMSDPSSLQAIQNIRLEWCLNIESLPFHNLHSLKHLTIDACTSIRVLQLEHLPSQLEELHIGCCFHLELIIGLGNLNMLAKLKISKCIVLNSITIDGLQSMEFTEPIGDSSHGKPPIGQQSITSLTSLEIEFCMRLCVLPDGLIPSRPCFVHVRRCGCANIKLGIDNKSNQVCSMQDGS